MPKQPSTIDNSHCYIGGPLTGKTQRLLSRTEELIGKGEDSILIFCANDWLAGVFSQNLAAKLGSDSAEVIVTTARTYAERIVYEPAAKELTGRRGRVMDPYEEKIFFEDMRTITMKGRRLRGILEFVYRELSELQDGADWDATYEEELVMRHARDILSFNGGILECELPGFAVKALESDASLQETYSRRHVIVDDYGSLSRGLQVFSTRLATESITIAGDETDCGPACDAHPYPAGISEFLLANPDTRVTTLASHLQPEGILKAITPIRADLQDEEQSETHARTEQEDRTELHPELFETKGVDIKIGKDMGDELKAIARIVHDARKNGKTVLVCGTDRVWRANVQRSLESVGYPSRAPQSPIRVRDFGDTRAIKRALADARAKLFADPHDSVAWRSIAGLGDYVAKSDALQQLRELTQDDNLGIERALEALSGGEIKGIGVLSHSMSDLLARYRDAKDALANGSWAQETAQSRKDTDTPWQASPIMVANPRDCFGAQADIVVFGGFVNGLIPSRDYFDPSKLIGNKLAQERRRNLQMIYLAAGCAREELVFTAFERASLEVAERLGLHIRRIKLRDGIRMTTVSPSVFLRTMNLA